MNRAINSQITGVSFGIIGKDEVKRMSVLHVEKWKSFDEVDQPQVGGLYDSVFGNPLHSH